jgi:hypothetical protein
MTKKEFLAYLYSPLESLGGQDQQNPIDPDVLAFIWWLSPIAEERDEEYRGAFKAILGEDPLWIPCMQCEHDGIFYDRVSEPRPRLLATESQYSSHKFITVPGDRILIGKCQKCGITEHLHELVIVHALEKRKKVMGELNIPAYILAEAGLEE